MWTFRSMYRAIGSLIASSARNRTKPAAAYAQTPAPAGRFQKTGTQRYPTTSSSTKFFGSESRHRRCAHGVSQ